MLSAIANSCGIMPKGLPKKSISRPATITRSRVPSGTRARNRLNRTTGRQGADLIQALENDTEYRNYFYDNMLIN